MNKQGKICQKEDTVNQTTPGPVSSKFSGNKNKKKDTRVGNGFLKSEYSYLFPEQPNLEDEISLRG